MTRETKIGLLVGLAFIIVIGILLSDHLTSATEPPQAQLAQVGNNVRSTTNAPGSNRNAQAGIFNNNPAQSPVAPTHAVPTQNELANRGAPPVQIINVGGPAGNAVSQPPLQANGPSQPPISMAPPVQQTQPQNTPQIVSNEQPLNPPMQEPVREQPPVAGPITDIARQHGEDLVNLNGQPMNNTNNIPGNNAGTITPPATNGSTYVAQAGDSVSRLASKFLGSNTKANRDAIVNANPSLKEDINKIIIGKSYIIPKGNKTEASVPDRASERQAQKPSTASSQDHWYTVKSGDSLWKIAEAQCGDAKAVAAIKELNKDILKNDTVQAGQKIRLPNAPK